MKRLRRRRRLLIAAMLAVLLLPAGGVLLFLNLHPVFLREDVIEQELTRRGYTCITLSTRPDPERKAECIRILEQRRAGDAWLL